LVERGHAGLAGRVGERDRIAHLGAVGLDGLAALAEDRLRRRSHGCSTIPGLTLNGHDAGPSRRVLPSETWGAGRREPSGGGRRRLGARRQGGGGPSWAARILARRAR